MDIYVFATPYRVTWDYYFLSREHTLEFKEWESKAEYEYVSCTSCHFWIQYISKPIYFWLQDLSYHSDYYIHEIR